METRRKLWPCQVGCLSGPGRAGQGASANCGNIQHSAVLPSSAQLSHTAVHCTNLQHSLGAIAQCHISPYIVSCYNIVVGPVSRPCSSVLTGQQHGKWRAVCTGNILPLFQNHCHGSSSSSSSSCYWWSELIKTRATAAVYHLNCNFQSHLFQESESILYVRGIFSTHKTIFPQNLNVQMDYGWATVNKFITIVEKCTF